MGLLTEPVGEASLGGCRGEISGPHAVPKVLRQREAERENEGYVYVMSGPPPHPHQCCCMLSEVCGCIDSAAHSQFPPVSNGDKKVK